MKKFCLNYCINLIRRHKNFDEIKLEEIAYGLEAIYIFIEKTVIIFALAFLLGIVKELLVLLFFYSFIRMSSFGLHATKSSICLLASSLTFLISPIVCKYITLDIYSKVILFILCILLIYKNAPADTYKRPIVSKKRRAIYKFISTLIAITYALISISSKNNLISNALLFSLIIQNFMIAPTIYKLFHLPYDNYKSYISNYGLN